MDDKVCTLATVGALVGHFGMIRDMDDVCVKKAQYKPNCFAFLFSRRMNSRLDWYKHGQYIAHGAMSPKPWRFQQLLKYMLISDPEDEGWWETVSLGQYS
jgi:hypothetical protein